MEKGFDNHLEEIESLRHEIINDKKGEVRHDNLFKIIIIGSSGKYSRVKTLFSDLVLGFL